MKIRSMLFIMVGLAAGLTACEDDTVIGPGFKCDVTNPVQDVLVDPSNAVILVHSPAQPGDTAQLRVVATNRFGGQRTDVPISFSSSNTAIATVDSSGVIHAVSPGTVTIKASSCGESSTVKVTVIASVTRVTVTPASDTVIAGDTATFTARAFGPDNERVPNVKFTFAAANSSVISTNDSTARIAPSAAGTITVQATGEGVTGTATLLSLARIFLAPSGSTNTIDVGDSFGCGLITLGQGFCWGMNNHQQIGAQTDSICFSGTNPGATVGDSLITSALPCSLVPVRISQTIDFMTISAGDSTGCAISLAGRAYCWGFGTHGEIGNGTTGDRPSPTLVTAALTFTSISVGGGHTCAIATGGVAYCWGDDTFGQLGDARLVSSTTPIPVSGGGGPAQLSSISAGYQHTCGLASDGTAFCWGRNNFGQLGNGSTSMSDTPVQVATGSKFSSISAGGDHTCGVTTGGAALCWGSNLVGQLGVGVLGGISAVPVAVGGGQTYSRISASNGTQFKGGVGLGHTCGLTTGGAVFCWGDDADLQLGRGPFTGGNGVSASPVQVGQGERAAGVTFTAISTGSRHSCAVGSDGNAYCWGSNVMGALGNTLQAAFRGFPQKVATPR